MKRSCVGGLPRIVSLITCLELEKDTGRMELAAMKMALLASLLPRMAEWPAIH